MPGPNIVVIIKGPGLPIEGRQWGAYKTALREIGLQRSKSERHNDRLQLKAGASLNIGPYQISKRT